MATVTIQSADLKRAVRWAAPDEDSTLPVLANVRVTVTAGQLVLAVYDWETLLLARYPGEGDGGTGSALIPAGPLAEAAGTLPAGPVEVSVHDDTVDLVTGPGTTSAHRLSIVQDCDPSCYPEFPAMPAITGWAAAEVLIPAVTLAAGCCSAEGELPLIRAVHFAAGAGVLDLEGTNRYIIGMHQVPFNPAAQKRDMLIPGPLAVRFAKAPTAGPVFLGADDAAVMLSDAWHTVVTKPPAGEYPKVRTVAARAAAASAKATIEIPVTDLAAACAAAKAAVDTHLDGYTDELIEAVDADEELSAAAKEAAKTDKRRHVATRRGRGMFLMVDGATPCGAEIVAVHPFTAAVLGRWPLAGATCDGEPVVCSLNPEYLRALLPAGGTVVLHLPGGYKPVRVTVAGSAWEGVICPIKEDPPADAAGGEAE
jgi:DNA polymerase III sliding clamp (beta) subunit (PCNA family)